MKPAAFRSARPAVWTSLAFVRRLQGQAVDAGGLGLRAVKHAAFKSAIPAVWTPLAYVKLAAFRVRPSMLAAWTSGL